MEIMQYNNRATVVVPNELMYWVIELFGSGILHNLLPFLVQFI